MVCLMGMNLRKFKRLVLKLWIVYGKCGIGKLRVLSVKVLVNLLVKVKSLIRLLFVF